MDSEFKQFLKPWNMIRLTSRKPLFEAKLGYVGAVFDDAFDFEEVTNPYEHFSNISDPPILKTHRVTEHDVKQFELHYNIKLPTD